MRILHISSVYPPHVVGGAERVVEILAEAQIAREHDVAAAYLSQHPQEPGVRHGVQVFPQTNRNLIWMEDVPKRPRLMRTANKVHQVVNQRAANDFADVVRRFRPDVVHTHSMVDLPPMIWSAVAGAGARIVHTLHDYDLICSRANLFRDGRSCEKLHPSCQIMKGWKSHFSGRIDAVAAVSSAVLEEHRRFGLFRHLPHTHARVVWNGVRSARQVGTAPGRVPVDGPFTFGYLGRLVPEKGVEILLQACRSLPPTGWRLKIAGRALGGDEWLREQARDLPVEFLGFTDAGEFLDTIDVLVVPSIWKEPFGMTVVEAFSHAVPVIGSDYGAIHDLAGAIGPEWLVQPGDAAALATRMSTVLAAGRQNLPPPEAFSAILDDVSEQQMAAKYDELYQAVMAGAVAA